MSVGVGLVFPRPLGEGEENGRHKMTTKGDRLGWIDDPRSLGTGSGLHSENPYVSRPTSTCLLLPSHPDLPGSLREVLPILSTRVVGFEY